MGAFVEVEGDEVTVGADGEFGRNNTYTYTITANLLWGILVTCLSMGFIRVERRDGKLFIEEVE